MEKIKDKAVRWHFIGHLQKNKVKLAVEMFDCIETVDSIELAQEINKRAKEPIDCFIEVNIAREKTKTGVDAEGAVKLARAASTLPNIRLKGLLTIPPQCDSPEFSRPYFVALRRLAERINKERIPGGLGPRYSGPGPRKRGRRRFSQQTPAFRQTEKCSQKRP